MRRLFLLAFMLFIGAVNGAEYQFCGTHYLASYNECDHEALCNLSSLQQTMENAVKACGAQVLEISKYIFPPDGITMVLLLSESHASIHTYPECDSCYIDLFTCGSSCDYRKFENILHAYLCPKSIEKQVIKR